MSKLCGVGHRLYNHTSKWSPSYEMPERERMALRDELISLSADAIKFVLTHQEGDAFYEKAYKDWCKRHKRCHKILHQLYTHGDVAWYTIRGLNIRWQWMDSFSKRAHYQYLKRIPLQFERMCAPEPEPMPRNPEHDALMHELDGISLRCKIDASPDVIKLDVWTTRLYERALSGDANALSSKDRAEGHMAHYMHMKLEGATFQMELKAPTPIKQSHKRALNEDREKRAKLIDKWRK